MLPRPALEHFTPRLYEETPGSAGLPGLIPVQSRRGCPMKCVYCTTPRLEGAATRAWAPEQVASWLAHWHEQWGLTRFYFVDNIFNCPPAYGRRLCRAIKELRLPLDWSCLINPAFPDPELFHLIRAAGGAMVQVGNESGSELVLTGLGKGFDRNQVELTLKLLEAADLPYTCFLLLGGPGETPETVQESVAFLERYEPKMVNLKVGIRIHPGLPLHRLALAEGVVRPADNLLWPRFYLAPAIREWIWDYLQGSDGPAPQLDFVRTVFVLVFVFVKPQKQKRQKTYKGLNMLHHGMMTSGSAPVGERSISGGTGPAGSAPPGSRRCPRSRRKNYACRLWPRPRPSLKASGPGRSTRRICGSWRKGTAPSNLPLMPRSSWRNTACRKSGAP